MNRNNYITDNSLFSLFLKSIDKKLIFIPLSLIIIGIFTLFSLRADLNLLKHIIYVSISLTAFIVIIFLKKNDLKIILNFSLFALISLLIFTHFFGHAENGSQRWIKYFGLSLQPSEVIKGPFICFISWFYYLSLKNTNYKIIFFPFTISVLVISLIASQPDFATSIYFFISFSLVSILYIRKIKFLFLLSLIGIFFMTLVIFLNSYIRDRIFGFFF